MCGSIVSLNQPLCHFMLAKQIIDLQNEYLVLPFKKCPICLWRVQCSPRIEKRNLPGLPKMKKKKKKVDLTETVAISIYSRLMMKFQ